MILYLITQIYFYIYVYHLCLFWWWLKLKCHKEGSKWKGKSLSLSDSLWLGQNIGVGSLSLFQVIFLTQWSNPGLLHCQLILYQLSHKESPRILEWVAYPFSSRSFQHRNWTRVSCIAGSKECWALKNWCSQIVVLEKTLQSPLDGKEIKTLNPKGNQPWIFIGRTGVKDWPPDAKNWLIGKDPDAGKDWAQEEKGTSEVEMVEWHHWLNGHESEQSLGDSEGQGSVACCSPWGRRESDMT